MREYIIKRLLMLIPVLFIVSLVVFSIIHLTPGDPAAVMLGETATQAEIDALRQRLGLDQPLFGQYLNYGKGRAKNILKHGTRPKLRQTVPAMVLPAVAGASLALIHWTAAVPIGIWLAICLGYGISMGIGHRDPRVLLTGLAVMIMHLAWSAGFWLQVLAARALGRRMS